MRAVLSGVAAAAAAALALAATPQQIHVSYGGTPSTFATITWATETACLSPSVLYGSAPDAMTPAPANYIEQDPQWTFGNSDGLQWVSRVRLPGLQPASRVYYSVACGADVSETFSFLTVPSDASDVPRILIWGDYGRDGGEQTMAALEEEAAATASGAPGSATFGIIAGDFAYNLDDLNGARGASFMARFQNISAMLPVMTVPGNHEQATGNMTHYTNIFGRSMPGPALGQWYSFNAGLIHFVMLSSEVFFMSPFNLTNEGGDTVHISVPAMLEWLKLDLAAASTPAARAQQPWIVAVYHRPFYCSNSDGDECSNSPLNWPTNPSRLAMEPLFMQYGVDLCIEAHEHSVELIYPLVNGTTTAQNYSEPRAPVHFVTGAGGCNEDLGICENPILLPSPFTDRYLWGPLQYSYTRMWAPNATVLHLEQVTVRPAPSVWAAIDIVQHSHGPFVQ